MDSRKEAMTLEHVLTMTTGLDWNEWNISYADSNNMYNQMMESTNPIQFFLDLPTVYDPGEHWAYSTGASHLLSAIIQEATNRTTREFADEYLFNPLNMTVGAWTTDLQGINNGGSELHVTPRTMVKLGLLYLNNGTWNSQEILTEEYVAASYYPHAYCELGWDYGYQLWIDSPDEQFSARGTAGQRIIVVSVVNIVIAITANARNPGEYIHEEIVEYVLNSILEEEAINTTTTWTGAKTGDYLLPVIGVAVVIMVAVAVIYVRRS